jgi:hypothetical protein
VEEQGNLVAQQGEIHFTVTVTRAATGKVETYDMVGIPDKQETEDKKDDCNE